MQWTVSEGYGLEDLVGAIVDGREVFALERRGDRYHLVRAPLWISGRHSLGPYRPVEPLKSLFFPPREDLGSLRSPRQPGSLPERIVFGVKNCDLSALGIHDHVFLDEDLKDPLYEEAREKTILVSADCTDCLPVCFCPLVGEQPYPEKGFDINISPMSGGMVVETGSERGARALQPAERYLEPAGEALLRAREEQRAAMQRKLVDQAEVWGLRPGMDFRQAVQDSIDSNLWEDFAVDCVECGACNFTCCTCHCFLLVDGLDTGKVPARAKQWDSCLFANFARTAGGGNPRSRRAERLRNRFDKKFSFFPEVMGRYACDGCGRCTEACIGKIDIRKVLKRAVDDSTLVHAHTGDD